MDLAKIRKKRKQQKKKAKKKKKEKKEEPVPEEILSDAGEEGGEVVSEEMAEALPAEEGVTDGEKEVVADDVAIGVPVQGPEEEIEQETVPLVEFLVFRLSDEHYAFKLSDLQEVMKDQIVTFVPKMPSFIVGITSLRGKIIPVMDLNARLSIKDGSQKSKRQIAIIKGEKGPIGLIIDEVDGVRRIEETNIKEPPSHLNDEQIKFIESVVRDGKKFISILYLNEVLSFEPSPM